MCDVIVFTNRFTNSQYQNETQRQNFRTSCNSLLMTQAKISFQSVVLTGQSMLYSVSGIRGDSENDGIYARLKINTV